MKGLEEEWMKLQKRLQRMTRPLKEMTVDGRISEGGDGGWPDLWKNSDTWHELLDGKSHTLDFKVKHYLLNWNQMRSPVICSSKCLAFLLHPVAHYLFSLWPTEGVTVLSTKYYAVKMASKNIKMQNNSYKEHPGYNNGLSRKCFQKKRLRQQAHRSLSSQQSSAKKQNYLWANGFFF